MIIEINATLKAGTEQAIEKMSDTKFQPGRSGNPGGRPKGLAARVRKLVDPDELIEFLLGVMRSPAEKTADRLAAVKLLGERGWGAPQQAIQIQAEIETQARALPSFDLSKLSEAELVQLEGVAARLLLPPGDA